MTKVPASSDTGPCRHDPRRQRPPVSLGGGHKYHCFSEIVRRRPPVGRDPNPDRTPCAQCANAHNWFFAHFAGARTATAPFRRPRRDQDCAAAISSQFSQRQLPDLGEVGVGIDPLTPEIAASFMPCFSPSR